MYLATLLLQIVPSWALLFGMAMIGVAALINIVYQIDRQRKKLQSTRPSSPSSASTSTDTEAPRLISHSISNEQSTLKVNLKNVGEPLIVKNLIVDRDKSNFLLSWASPTQADQKIGRKRIMRLEFSLFEGIEDYKDAAGTFQLIYTDLQDQRYRQTINIKDGTIHLAFPQPQKEKK